MAREERLAAGPGEEAEVLRVGLRGDRQPARGARARAPRACAARRAGSAAGEATPAPARRACSSGPCRASAATRSRPAAGARVVAGRERVGAEALGELEHRVEPHAAVAAHARVRRQPGGVRRRATARRRRRGTRRAGRARGAAGRARARARERRAPPAREQQLRSPSFSGSDHSSSVTATARVPAQHRRDGAVDAAAHRDQQRARAPARARAARAPRRRARGAARRRRARRRGAWPARARRARPRSHRPRRAPPRAAARPLDERHRGAAGGDRACRSRARRSRRRRRARRSSASETRTRSPQAAPPAAPVWRTGGHHPAPARALEVVAQRHPASMAPGRASAVRGGSLS